MEEQAVFNTIGTFAAANGLICCTSLIGLGLIGALAVRQKTRSPGLLFGGLGFVFLACANAGFAAQIITALAIGWDSEDATLFLDWLNRMNCAFSVTAVMGLVSLILAFTYTYRRFLPAWREIIIDEGDGPSSLGKILIVVGIAIAVVGGALWLAGRVGLPLGRLPGDIRIEREGFSLYIPIATSIVLSLALTIILNIIFRWLRK